MRIIMPKLREGMRVKLTQQALDDDEAVASLLRGLTGEITDIDETSELPIEVFFSECREWYTWFFTEADLQEVNE